MSHLRSNNPNDLTRPHLLNTILPGQHQLRTNPQPNPPPSPRPPTPTTPHGHLMTPSQLSKHSTPPNNQPNSRTNHHHRPIQLIQPNTHPHRSRNPTNRLLHLIHTHNNTTRLTPIPYHIHPKLLYTRTPPYSPTHDSYNPTYPKTRPHLRHSHMQV